MDPKKAAAEWFRTTVFRDETIRPGPVHSAERLPAILRTARSLAKNSFHSWQSAESLFLKQGKLLANYEDDYDFSSAAVHYYPTYQSLTDRELRGYFSWRTKLRQGDVQEAPLCFAFLYIYELLNQIGVADPTDGYRKLEQFRDIYSRIDSRILSYLEQWLADYVVYYDLDPALLTGSEREQKIVVLERIQEESMGRIIDAVNCLSRSYLDRSRFYKTNSENMNTVIVRVLRRMSDHYAARCKKTMTEQYFGACRWNNTRLFDSAVFGDPLKRRSYEYSIDGRCVYRCQDGAWFAWGRSHPPSPSNMLGDLLKAIDSVMRTAYAYGYPIKAKADAKWVLRTIQEEVQGLLAEHKAAEKKIAIDYTQLSKIRRDAAVTQEKLIVEADMDPPAEPTSQEPEQLSLIPAPDSDRPSGGAEDTPLSPAEYRLVRCLLYGGELGWVQPEGYLLSLLVDGINEKLYDTFQDSVLDDTPCLFEDYIDDLKEMIRP